MFVIGDASALKQKLPATAQGACLRLSSWCTPSDPLYPSTVASQEAHWLSKILNAEARGQESPGGFTFHNRGVRPLCPYYLSLLTSVTRRPWHTSAIGPPSSTGAKSKKDQKAS